MLSAVYSQELSSEDVLGKVLDHGSYDVYTRLQEVMDYAVDVVKLSSIAYVLKGLGLMEEFTDAVALVKCLVGKMVVLMNTGVYVNGLASELSSLISRSLWSSEMSEDRLRTFLNTLISVWSSLSDRCAASRYLARVTASTFGFKLGDSRILTKAVESCNTALVVQAALNALLISCGGVCFANIVKD
ncbi:MAG: hypothetical protein DRO09_03415 [Thermoprotei archaeon]|nr:MAG: hypothetical protein DRO09_03415 [Thermoprotei archaeon]